MRGKRLHLTIWVWPLALMLLMPAAALAFLPPDAPLGALDQQAQRHRTQFQAQHMSGKLIDEELAHGWDSMWPPARPGNQPLALGDKGPGVAALGQKHPGGGPPGGGPPGGGPPGGGPPGGGPPGGGPPGGGPPGGGPPGGGPPGGGHPPGGAVPEPASLILLGSALAGAAGWRALRRRREE